MTVGVQRTLPSRLLPVTVWPLLWACGDGETGRAPTAGEPELPAPITIVKERACAVAVDGNDLYWVSEEGDEREGSSLNRTTIAGEEPVLLGPATPCSFLQVAAGNIYYSRVYGLTRRSVDGETTAILGYPQDVAPGPSGIAPVEWVDEALIDSKPQFPAEDDGTHLGVKSGSAWTDAAELWWTRATTGGVGIFTAPLEGGDVTLLYAGPAIAIAPVVAESDVYWATLEMPNPDDPSSYMTSIQAVPRAGGQAVTLFTHNGRPESLALGGEDVYFLYSSFDGAGIVRLPGGGGEPVELVTGALAMAVDAGALYWIQSDDGQLTVRRRTHVGGDLATLAAWAWLDPLLVLDETNVYFLDDEQIMRAPKEPVSR
jgi:hypothetical protein